MTADIAPLIRTRLAPPRIAAPALARDGIVDRLHARRDRSLSLITGPAGSGKTTLAALWRQRLIADGVHVAWYNVAADDDEVQWAAYCFASLQDAGVDTGPAVAQTLQRESLEIAERFVTQLVNAVFAHAHPVVLVLEDFGAVRARRPIDLLQQLLDVLPTNLHIVITARTLPAIELAALRLHDQVTEVGFDELRLSAAEQSTLIESIGTTRLTEHQARRLFALTEGWAAGARLAALALKKERDTDALLARLSRLPPSSATDEDLSAYVEDALISILEPQQLDSLVRMSACRRVNASLCDAICGRADAGTLLDSLAAQQYFVASVESDDPLQWYRFHRIFAAFLRRRLMSLDPDELRTINRRASLWFEQHGLIAEALRHARHAGDTRRMAMLIGDAARPMLYAGQFLPLLRWAAELPEAARAEHIDVLLSIGWSQVSMRRRGEAATTMALIGSHPAATDAEVDFELRLMRAFDLIMRDDTAAAMALLQPILDRRPQADGFNLLMLGAIGGMALNGAGRFEDARDLAADCQAALRSRHGMRARPWLEGVAGHSFLVAGDFLQARDILARALRKLDREEQLAEFSAGHLAGYLAEIYYQLNNPDAAEDHFEIYAETGDITGNPDASLHALRSRARLHAMRADEARALAALDDMERLAQDEGWDRVAAWSLAERVRILGRPGASLTAMREALRRLRRLASRQLGSSGVRAEIGIALSIAEVDAAAAELDWSRALDLSRPLASELRTRGRMFLASRQNLMAAIALRALRQTDAALATGRSLLLTAEHCGMFRLLLDGGHHALELATVLRGAPDLRPEERRLLDDSLRIPSGDTAAGKAVPAARPAADLSPKEQEIMGLLDRALSIKTIARALSVSPETIKWHLKNVYSKLGAVSREDAVAKARAMRIIPPGIED